jgi:DNA-binding transcriptional LysR family regulator
MELRHLRYFVAVAEELSFTRGAEKLRIAQPSLTRQIKDLEEEIGARLLDRSKKRVKLTKEGECLLAGAKRLLNFSTEIVESVRELGRQSSSIRIGYVPNPFHRVLPISISTFEQRFPTVSVKLFGVGPGEQFQALADGKLDIAFVGTSELSEESGLEFRVVTSYPVLALLPKTNRLASRSVIKLIDLESMFFIGLSDAGYPGYPAWLAATCGAAGFNPKILEVVDSEFQVIQAVRSELGVALLPEQIRNVPHQNLRIRTVTPQPLIDSAVAWRTDNCSPVLQAYLGTLENIGRKMRSMVSSAL